MTRRDFVQTGLALSAGAVLATGPARAAASSRTRLAVVGTGVRALFYLHGLQRGHAGRLEIAALSDPNPGRLGFARGVCRQLGADPKAFHSDEFERMIRETRPEVVLVTTPDYTHDGYIERALEAGCDVVTEKPMTTDAEKCQRILDAVKRTGRSCRVTFNYRYSPPRTQVKELLMQGVIGDVLSIDFHWMLNTHHGADYFRRWHSQKAFSGGLMVHKATHHFDLVNWWLSAVPTSVYAVGKREFYTPAMARRLGLESHHERCHTCPEKERCGFFFDLSQGYLRSLYLDNESHDGYLRDRCVFRPEIDIEDSMSVVVTYDDGVQMSYSLNAMNAWEGYHVVFNGTEGRLEHTVEEQLYVSGTAAEQGAIRPGGVRTRLFPLRGSPRDVEVWAAEGGHGGGDALLLDDLFRPQPPPDKYLRAADQRSGAYSILTGIAANQSMATGAPVWIADLVTGLDAPDYPKMPSRTAPLRMPARHAE